MNILDEDIGRSQRQQLRIKNLITSRFRAEDKGLKPLVLTADREIILSPFLTVWKVHCRQIGEGIGRLGMKDREGIIPLLHQLKRSTFFTLDHGFYHPTLLHQGYRLVFLDVRDNEAAEYTRRLLRHPAFRTRSQRMGKVVRVRHSGGSYWQVHQREEQDFNW